MGSRDEHPSMTMPERPLTMPSPSRLPPDHPMRAEILAAHAAAMAAGEDGYTDPATSLFVFHRAASRGAQAMLRERLPALPILLRGGSRPGLVAGGDLDASAIWSGRLPNRIY
jgi:hypothetical protein